jgi:eukaryotic-like serine/threonine-protein kinase
MTPERWQQIEQLYHAALERAAVERTAFLAEACAGDEALRAEIEALLAANADAGSFMAAPALELEARRTAAAADLGSGQQLGHYRVLAKIGAGGMGEVYLARDLKLDRKVALKVLPAAFTADAERLQRFVREAKAVSALNHPNIITIYEISESVTPTQTGTTHFIATEFIEGVTLRARLAKGRLPLREALEIVQQIARALEAAHRAGIVHRDIKPENIMLRPDGLIKVLDFGLARVTEHHFEEVDTQATTAVRLKTEPGIVLGTVYYMSPEQARGLEVDARSDVFSLGIVLYEMVTGQRPFQGATLTDVLVSIVDKAPPPLKAHVPEAPEELQQIVNRALEKDCEQRYATVSECGTDLEWLKHSLVRQGSSPTLRLPASASARNSAAALALSAGSAAAEKSVALRGWRASRAVGALLGALALLTALGFGLYRWLAPVGEEAAFQNMAFSKLTLTGNVYAYRPAISPAGQYVAYVIQEGKEQSLWMSDVKLGSQIQKVPLARVVYRGLTFSREGDLLFYVVSDELGKPVLYQLSVLGGKPQKVLSGISSSPITFSPAGDRFAFINEQNDSLLSAQRNGSDHRLLLKHGQDEVLIYPAWSPEGQIIICGAASRKSRASRLLAINAETGVAQPVVSPPWLDVLGVSWLPDGSALILNAVDPESRLPQIWQLSYPGGQARRITNDLNHYFGASLAADGGKLVCLRRERIVNLWLAPDGDAKRARQLTSGASREDGVQGLAWLPDGKIVYSSAITGTTNLWLMDVANNDNQPLTAQASSNYAPAVAPDGRTIVFVSERTGSPTLWRMEPDGSNQRPLADLTGEAFRPTFSPDGQWVIFEWRPKVGASTTLWRLSLAGGSPMQLTTEDSIKAVVASDGKLIAFSYGSRTPTSPAKLALLPLSGGAPIKTLKLPAIASSPVFKWTRNGGGLSYLDSQDKHGNLWGQPLNGGPARQLTDFKTGQTFYFDWSRDGKQLACSRGTETVDVILISNIRK